MRAIIAYCMIGLLMAAATAQVAPNLREVSVSQAIPSETQQLYNTLKVQQNTVDALRQTVKKMDARQRVVLSQLSHSVRPIHQSPFYTVHTHDSGAQVWGGLSIEQWLMLILASGVIWFVLGTENSAMRSGSSEHAKRAQRARVSDDLDAEVSTEGQMSASSKMGASIENEYDFLASDAGCASQLDLAQAYLEMGELMSAREAIDQVLMRGTTQQKEQAQHLLHIWQTAQV